MTNESFRELILALRDAGLAAEADALAAAIARGATGSEALAGARPIVRRLRSAQAVQRDPALRALLEPCLEAVNRAWPGWR